MEKNLDLNNVIKMTKDLPEDFIVMNLGIIVHEYLSETINEENTEKKEALFQKVVAACLAVVMKHVNNSNNK